MGEAFKALFQEWFGGGQQVQQPKVGAYPADYSALTNAEIAAPASCDQLVASTQWIPVNRKA